jgi:subtilisin family serine protease
VDGPAAALTDPPSIPGEFIVAASPEAAAAAGLTVLGEAGFGWTLVSTSGSAPDDRIAEIADTAGFQVEPNYVYQLADEPLFPDQWSLENNGQTGGTADADIDILDAWDFTTGAPTVVIAVLDTGVAFGHPDLSGQIWANSDEIGGNGVDDDRNGYIDDVRGWDAIASDADPTDTHGHGTFVATSAAAAVNGVGMAGVAPGARIMPIRVCDNFGCPLSAILTGLDYALANGADVANLSFGGGSSSSDGLLETAVQSVVDGGTTVVAAAGNASQNNDLVPFFPASYDIDGLISVAASDHNDSLAGFSNYGATTVDLAAPGQDVVGGVIVPPNSWDSDSGTSFSSPKVAGVAALIKAVRPEAPPVEVAKMIIDSADHLPGLSGKMVSGGRLNAGSALRLATAPVAVAKAVPANGTFPLTFHLDGSGSFDPLGGIVNSSWKLPDGSIASGIETDWRPDMPGTYQATLTVTDDDGLTDSATVSFSTFLPPGGTFIDDNGHFAEGAIEAIYAVGITRGCNPPTNNRFCPDADVTREQMATFLARALGLSATSTDHFDDDNGSVLESAINRLAEAGITVGCNPPANTNFCPGDPVTRAEMAAFLARAFGLTTINEDHFVDDDGSVFETAINRLAEAGITVGCNPPDGDRYCPDSPVKRGQMAVFLTRAIGGLRPIYPPAPD